MIKKQPPSLRRRYIGLTLLLGILVIGFVVNVYLDLSEKNKLATQTLSEIDQHLNTIDNIRGHTSVFYRSVNLFINNPEDTDHINNINNALTKAIEQSHLFKSANDKQEISVLRKELTSKLDELKPLISLLVDIRRDANKQYPGMSLSANIMAQQQDTLKGKLKILQQEIENGDYFPRSERLLKELFEARLLVEKEISQIRIYIANRLALFSDEILSNQASSLIEIHNTFLKKINVIQNLYKHEPDSFEGPEGINIIKELQLAWYDNFIILRELSESDHWREDSHLMENSIAPKIHEISSILFNINQYLRQQKKITTESFNESSQALFYILSIIIGLFLLYIFMIQISMEYMVFKPILNIAEVMKLKAFGHTNKQFSEKQSKETQNIVTAFNKLENKVSSRTRKMIRAIDESRAAVKEAKIANQAKSTFLANMSHELRTPLHGILSFADLGSSKAGKIDEKKTRQYFDLITESGQRLLLLLNDLLDLEKLESGRIELNLQNNCLQQTTHAVINHIHALSEKKNLQVSVNCDECPETIVYDDEKIMQVINNLLSNAIKFSPENDEIQVILKSTRFEDENMAEFVIEDNGVGIPDDELDKVFDKFIQSSKTQTGAGGTGLGLSICHEIIKLHHGVIRAEKKTAPGARFVFYIPITQKKKEED